MALANPKCNLKELQCGFFHTGVCERELVEKNTSVVDLQLCDPLSEKELGGITASLWVDEYLQMFSCLKKLVLDECSHIVFLTHYLKSDSSTIEDLSLRSNNIRRCDFLSFIWKLPKMKSLLSVDFSGNPFERQDDSGLWMGEYKEAVKSNRYIEHAKFAHPDFNHDTGAFAEASGYLLLNRLCRFYNVTSTKSGDWLDVLLKMPNSPSIIFLVLRYEWFTGDRKKKSAKAQFNARRRRLRSY